MLKIRENILRVVLTAIVRQGIPAVLGALGAFMALNVPEWHVAFCQVAQ